MPDETVDLRFLAEQRSRILAEFGEMRGQTQLIPQIAGAVSELQRDVSELQIALAATHADVSVIKETVEKIHETQQSHGARLNAIDGRLAIIEKHTGLVKA